MSSGFERFAENVAILPGNEEVQQWTDLLTERVWDHVDPKTGDYDLEGFMAHCAADTIDVTVGQALGYLNYAQECVRGE